MNQKGLHIVLILSFLLTIGCSEKASKETQYQEEIEQMNSYLYENQDRGIRVQEGNGWFVEKETKTTVKFKNERLVAIVSIVPKEKSTAEIKRGLVAGTGDVTVIGEGIDFIIWKTERKESIRTEVHVVEGLTHNYIVTLMCPFELYEEKQKKLDDFKYSIDFF